MVALGVVVVAAFIASVLLLGDSPGSPSTEFIWWDGTSAGTVCSSVGRIVLMGQNLYIGDSEIDPAVVAECERLAAVPGATGLSVLVAGILAFAALTLMMFRGRRVTPHGQPISRKGLRVEDAGEPLL